MNDKGGIILVSGATGKQGGAVARCLLANGWHVRALSRNPEKPEAKALSEKGAEVVKGDLNDRASLNQALQNVYGVFSVQNFWEHGAAVEIKQGKTLADASKAAGIKHLVYSSVGGAERKTGIHHFDSKWQVELHIRSLNLPATVLRPVAFMEAFNDPRARKFILKGTLMFPLRSDKPLQMIAVADIGAFATLAFEKPKDFMGRAIEIAGDELTMPQIAEGFTQVLGRRVRSRKMPMILARIFMGKEMTAMMKWFNKEGYQADIPALRKMHPKLMTLEAWLHKTGWDKIKQ